TGTELGPWGYLPTDPAKLREELDRRGLQLLAAFVPIRFAEPAAIGPSEDIALQTAALLAALGAKYVVLADDNMTSQVRIDRAGSIRPEDSLTNEQWKVYANGVNRVATKINDQYGLAVAFHHHCGGFIETPQEIERLMELTKPEIVGLCLDTGHYVFGGGNAV